MPTMTHQDLLAAAVLALAARDTDYATEQNGVGYNGTDTGFGNRLAATPVERWTAGNRHEAYEMLRKYRGQLAVYGIDYDEIPAPEHGAERSRRTWRAGAHTVDFDGQLVMVAQYSDGLVAEQKAIAGRRWDGAANRFPETSAAEVAALLARHADLGWEITPAAQAVLDVAWEVPAETAAPAKVAVSMVGDRIALAFGYDPEMVAESRSIMGRRWDAARKLNTFPLTPGSAMGIEGFLARYEPVSYTPEALAALEGLAAAGREQAAVQEGLADLSRAKDSGVEIDGLGGTLRPFQRAGVEYVTRAGGRSFIADDMGCIDGEAIVHMNRAGRGFSVTLAKACARFNCNDGRYDWDPEIPTYARALVNGELRQHRVVGIFDKGEAETITVTFESGKAITLTPDHELITPQGVWVEAGALAPGSYVLGNGAAGCAMCGSTDDLIRSKTARFYGYCRRCMYQHLRAKPTFNEGRTIDKDGYVRIWHMSDHPRAAKWGWVAEHILVAEQMLGRPIGSDEHIHHKNGIKSDNRPENLEVLRPAEHHRLHADYRQISRDRWGHHLPFVPTVETVVGIASAGRRRVYDMMMEHPHRNFVANGIIGHNTGKTVQALAAVQAKQAFPAVVVCPASVKLSWRDHVNGSVPGAPDGWLPGRTVKVLKGRAPNGERAEGADVYVINYDILSGWVDELKAIAPRALILDESHYAKSGKAARTKAAKALAKAIPADGLVLNLTGTAVLNRPIELAAQLEIIGRLDDLGGFWQYAKRYCGAYQDRFGWRMDGAFHLDELNAKLRATCFIRRMKSEIMAELPAKQIARVAVPLSNQAEYDRAEAETVRWLVEQVEADEAFAAEIADLPEDEQAQMLAARKVDVAESARRAEHLVRLNALRRVAARGKLAAAREWVTDFLEGTDEKLIVFAHHVEVQRALLADFPEAARVLGEDSPERRAEQVARFQDDPECRLIVCSLQAAGIGITLTAASNVAFVELGWTPALHDQAEDRAHRMGQQGNVTCWYLLADGTIDDDMHDLIEQKRAVVTAATDGTAAERTESIMGALEARMMARARA